MKTKGGEKKKVSVITLGCSKNLVDSENLITQLQGERFDVVHDRVENPDVVVINTCGFIDRAKEESVNTILEFARLKSAGDLEKLYVTGCLSERYKDDLQKEIPEVDAYFGTMELPALLQKFDMNYRHELIGERWISTPAHYAYLKISEGCNRTCSFCAIPLMRGGHRSKPIEVLVDEAKSLVRRGVREIILIAQELTYYGLDLYKKRTLSDLLNHLADIEGLKWIRLHYAYPSKFPLDVLDTMANRSNICKYLDIPLQHASNRILQRMKRQITREETEDLLRIARQKVPDLTLRTTMLVGFPGETEEDFKELMEFVQEYQFDRLGVFEYSHEENTTAYLLADNIPQEVKRSRVETLMDLQRKISETKNQSKIDRVYNVLFDRKEGGYFIGRTEGDSPEVDNEVLLDANKWYVRIGDFANVKIYDATEFDLFGDLVE